MLETISRPKMHSEHSLLQDFYQSFRHSQGNPDLQDYLAEYIARQYRPSDFDSIEALKKKLDGKIAKMRVPKNHINGTSINGVATELTPAAAYMAHNGFNERWDFQVTVLGHVLGEKINKNPSFINVASNEDLLNAITREILLREIRFQESERPNREDGSDSHDSILRAHAFNRKTTGSSSFDKLYGGIRSLLEEASTSPQRSTNLVLGLFVKLQELWEKNHPGQKFLQPHLPDPRG